MVPYRVPYGALRLVVPYPVPYVPYDGPGALTVP